MVISAMVVLLRSGVRLELVGVLLADGFAGLAPGGHAAAHRVGVVSLFGEEPGRGGGADAGGADGNHGPGLLDPGSAGLQPVQGDVLGLRRTAGPPFLGGPDVDERGPGTEEFLGLRYGNRLVGLAEGLLEGIDESHDVSPLWMGQAVTVPAVTHAATAKMRTANEMRMCLSCRWRANRAATTDPTIAGMANARVVAQSMV